MKKDECGGQRQRVDGGKGMGKRENDSGSSPLCMRSREAPALKMFHWIGYIR